MRIPGCLRSRLYRNEHMFVDVPSETFFFGGNASRSNFPRYLWYFAPAQNTTNSVGNLSHAAFASHHLVGHELWSEVADWLAFGAMVLSGARACGELIQARRLLEGLIELACRTAGYRCRSTLARIITLRPSPLTPPLAPPIFDEMPIVDRAIFLRHSHDLHHLNSINIVTTWEILHLDFIKYATNWWYMVFQI